MRIIITTMLLSVLSLFPSSGAQAVRQVTTASESASLRCTRRKSEKAAKAESREDVRRYTMEGLACSEKCLIETPNLTACTYYRAVNRGLLLETNLVNPKFHLRQLINDFKIASELDATYDDGGALRALGTIFLKLPTLPTMGGAYTRDLDQAAEYARKALLIDADHPENLKLAGEVAFQRKDFKDALRYFKQTLKVVRKSDLTADKKQELVPELERWIEKAKGRL